MKVYLKTIIPIFNTPNSSLCHFSSLQTNPRFTINHHQSLHNQRKGEKLKMPLYDCMLLLKPQVNKTSLMELVSRVGKHVCRRNGVITDLKSYGNVQLGYGIKKLDGRYYQGTLMQMTMMTPPSFNKELHYLNKEDRLLRWILVKHRDFKIGGDYEDDGGSDMRMIRSGLYDVDSEEDEDSVDEDEEDEGEK